MCLEKSEDGQGSLGFGQEWDGDGLQWNLNPRARHRASWWREDKVPVSQWLCSQCQGGAEADVPQAAGTPQGRGLHQEVEENDPEMLWENEKNSDLTAWPQEQLQW